MNTYIENTDATTEAKAMSGDILDNFRVINGYAKVAHTTRNIFHTHFLDVATGECGIADLIRRILRENNSVFKAQVKNDSGELIPIESSELRPIAIAGSMFTSEIIAEVQKRFTAGTIRYPAKTIKAYLSVHLAGEKGDHTVGKIQLFNHEDSQRDCSKPRCKWYLVQEKENS